MNGPFFVGTRSGKEAVMAGLTKQQDAYGQAMWDAIDDPQAACVIERDDGLVDVHHTRHYMSEFKDWPSHQKKAIRLAIA